jgi:hypothetical protein
MTVIVAALALGTVLGLRSGRRGGRVFANSVPATHFGSVTRLTDVAVGTRFLLGKVGSDAAHVALCGATDVPLGVIDDTASDAGEDVSVQLLGCADSTLRMVASAAVSAGSPVYAAASGKVRVLPSSAGTYYLVGIALTAATADGQVIEVDPVAAVRTVVA